MSVRETARRQYIKLIDRASAQVGTLRAPSEGWLSTMRKALGMSGPQVARRAGVTRAAIYQAEHNEQEGAITLKQMEKLAAALGGRFVYAIVPEGTIEEMMKAQARRKAEALVRRARSHMALEKQALSEEQTLQEIERLAEDLVRSPPSDFWEER